MKRLLIIFVLLLWAVEGLGQACSSQCVGGSLIGYSGAISCACGIQWDTNQVTNPTGNEIRSFDVYWPTALGVTNTNRIIMELHGGGFAGKTHDSGDYPDPTFIDENVNPTSGTPNNLYIPNYTVSELGILTATLNAGSCSMSLASHYGCGGYWWPTGGTPFPILVDSGPNQESLVVTNMSGSCSAATWTLQSCATKTHTVSTWGLTSATPLGDGTQTVYTGTITGGANNALAGTIITTSGFVITGSLCPNYICNDGTYMVVSSTSTTLTVDNPYGVSETHAASATNHIYQWLTNVQPPVALRDLASFMSFLAHCAYGGTSYNSGTCASVAGAANMPGNPHQIIDTAGSAGGMWALLLLQGGCNNGSTCLFLDNNLATSAKAILPGTIRIGQ